MGFQKRFRRVAPPEYGEAVFRLLANPTGKLYDDLLNGDTMTEERAQRLGRALQEAYGGDRVEAYGAVFDFSTPEAAVATLRDDATPIDLRSWLRNAPIEIVSYEREQLSKNFSASLLPGS